MFENNDKFLKIASTILKCIVTLLISLGCLLCFVFMVDGDTAGLGFILLIINLISAGLTWVFGNLMLSFFCDVKLIRNKLYGDNNLNTDIYLTESDKSAMQNKIAKEKENSESDIYKI